MSEPAQRVRYTYEEYRLFEDSADVKHEYLDGQILAMAGGTPSHAALAAAVIGNLERQLEGQPCYTLTADLRVRIPATGMATYPDVTVVCGDALFDSHDPNAVVNPTLLVEILSDRTEAYDRGEKFEHYRRLPSLQEYVVVSHRERSIEIWRRDAQGTWSRRACGRGEAATLTSIQVELHVDRIYDRSPLTRAL